MTRLLAIDAAQIILIVFIVLLLIAYPILISTRNKKEKQKLTEQTNSLKRGDKVLTTSGIYGTIVDLHLDNDKQIVTIETGTGNRKGYFSIDAYAIYTVFKDEEPQKADEKAEKPANADKNAGATVKTANSAEKAVNPTAKTANPEKKTVENTTKVVEVKKQNNTLNKPQTAEQNAKKPATSAKLDIKK